jgi:hypothetical protein
MSTDHTTSSSRRPIVEAGWDQATFRCGRCGAVRTAATEDAHIRAVGIHRDAHALADRLNLTERDGLASILRVVLAAPDLCAEFLALMDQDGRSQ